jgi:arylformamidase
MNLDLEVEYNNRARVPTHPVVIAGWANDSASYRALAADRHTKIQYGLSPRQYLDVFKPASQIANMPTVMFIHGGYWQALSPSSFSHMARGLNERGISVAIAGYDLCPDVGMADIVEQMISAAHLLVKQTKKPIIACGHSAGGHLAACLAATDWLNIDEKLPAHSVPAGLALSGLFELEPLVPTSVNQKLGLDIQSARALSPRLWLPPKGIVFDAWVGADESAEYHRQSQTITAVWSASGNTTRCISVPGANHFTVIAPMTDPASALTSCLVEIASNLK